VDRHPGGAIQRLKCCYDGPQFHDVIGCYRPSSRTQSLAQGPEDDGPIPCRARVAQRAPARIDIVRGERLAGFCGVPFVRMLTRSGI